MVVDRHPHTIFLIGKESPQTMLAILLQKLITAVVVVVVLFANHHVEAGVSCHKINAKGEGEGVDCGTTPADACTVASIQGGGFVAGQHRSRVFFRIVTAYGRV